MLKRLAIVALAIVIPTGNVMATDISGCINSCEAARLRAQQGCMSLYSEPSRYTACLSDANNNYYACTGACYAGG